MVFDASGTYIEDGANQAYTRGGVIGENLGLEWGGRWPGKTFDPSHFQLTKGLPMPLIRARYEGGLDVFTGH